MVPGLGAGGFTAMGGAVGGACGNSGLDAMLGVAGGLVARSPELSTMFFTISANGFGASLPKPCCAGEFAGTAGLPAGGCTGVAG
jgi:hypothetical protein